MLDYKRKLEYTGKTKVATKQDIIEMMEDKFSQKNVKFLSFYNSEFNMIINDPSYMVLPLDDRIITRAHAVFEAVSLRNFQFFSLDLHLERFASSAEKTNIPFPMKKSKMRQIMIDVAQNAYSELKSQGYSEEECSKLTLNMRTWISSGRKDFGIYNEGKTPIFYCLAYFDPGYQKKSSDVESEGVKEFSTVPQQKVDALVTCKSTQYLKNAVQASFAKSLGGYQGIGLDNDGNLLEEAMANIAYIDKNTREFVHVPYGKIIQSTTLKKVLQNYVEPVLINEKNSITKITQKYFKPEEVIQNASEFISFGGDKILPIVELNNDKIADGKRGKICKKIQTWYNEQRVTQFEVPIPFESED